jgi:hypothetical protein
MSEEIVLIAVPSAPALVGVEIQRGVTGAAATIEVGTVTTGAAGSSATVTNSGTTGAAVLDFTIPRGATGETGEAATISVGTVTTGAAGSSVVVENTGTENDAVLDFTIPKGDKGDAATVAVGTVAQARQVLPQR